MLRPPAGSLPARAPRASKPRRPAPAKPHPHSSLPVSISVIGAVAVVWLGVTLSKPGLGLLVAIGALPATVRTLIVVGRRQAAGKATSAVDSGLMFFGSLVVTALLLVSVFFAAAGVLVVGLFAMCASGTHLPDRQAAVTGGVILFLVLLGVAGWGFRSLIRTRFREDISRL